jgi:hypothetical protein
MKVKETPLYNNRKKLLTMEVLCGSSQRNRQVLMERVQEIKTNKYTEPGGWRKNIQAFYLSDLRF